ncbi:MAG: hypothetical protein GF317_21090 [Candidatus Lokiarchaeota archaeon]|nr:hypothetical protein [Candidatus Lokiarchaeota archaeon]MBD3201941.1 hypothetical protein [Candidatus Lokiarchaeota archaeon]
MLNLKIEKKTFYRIFVLILSITFLGGMLQPIQQELNVSKDFAIKYSKSLKISEIFGNNLNSTYSNASYIGEALDNQLGNSLSIIGDVNGDGFDDFMIGAGRNDDGGDLAGKAYLFFGKVSGWYNGLNISQADASFIGENTWDRFTSSISGVGDVNGDGYDDFLIGAHYNNDGPGSNAGKCYLFFGKENGWQRDFSCSQADASFIGEADSDYLGNSVAGIGDVNGDGYDDFMIGSGSNDEGGLSAGKSYLFFGRETGWIQNVGCSTANVSYIGESANDVSGKELSGVGDVNNDSYDDFLICADSNSDGGLSAGKVYLFFGKVSGWHNSIVSECGASFIGEISNDRLGSSTSGAGDINGDGYDDFLIGAAYNDDGDGDNAGKSYLIFGKKTGWKRKLNCSEADASFMGESDSDFSGEAVSMVGDVNGDGYDDFLIGASSNDDGGLSAGKSYLFFGEENGWERNINCSQADASFIGENSVIQFGESLSGVGDVNGDDLDDMMISAQLNDEGGTDSGKVYLFFGRLFENSPSGSTNSPTNEIPGFNILFLFTLFGISILLIINYKFHKK